MMYYGGQSNVVRFFAIFLTIVALSALYFGLEIFKSLVVDYLWRSHSAQNWPQVPAKVLKVDWVWYQAKSRTAGLVGKDMRVNIRYEYTYMGKIYQGDHVGFEAFAARNENLYRSLEFSRHHGRAVTAWVNPETPSDAVVDPNIRWIAIVTYVLTGGMLTGIGGGLLLLLGRSAWPSRKP